jgi:hypothetical protein
MDADISGSHVHFDRVADPVEAAVIMLRMRPNSVFRLTSVIPVVVHRAQIQMRLF